MVQSLLDGAAARGEASSPGLRRRVERAVLGYLLGLGQPDWGAPWLWVWVLPVGRSFAGAGIPERAFGAWQSVLAAGRQQSGVRGRMPMPPTHGIPITSFESPDSRRSRLARWCPQESVTN